MSFVDILMIVGVVLGFVFSYFLVGGGGGGEVGEAGGEVGGEVGGGVGEAVDEVGEVGGEELECHFCHEPGKELFVGEFSPGACSIYPFKAWERICVGCYTRLDELAESGFVGNRGDIGFGVPPPEYYTGPVMDEDGFDEAGNYVADGFIPGLDGEDDVFLDDFEDDLGEFDEAVLLFDLVVGSDEFSGDEFWDELEEDWDWAIDSREFLHAFEFFNDWDCAEDEVFIARLMGIGMEECRWCRGGHYVYLNVFE